MIFKVNRSDAADSDAFYIEAPDLYSIREQVRSRFGEVALGRLKRTAPGWAMMQYDIVTEVPDGATVIREVFSGGGPEPADSATTL